MINIGASGFGHAPKQEEVLIQRSEFILGQGYILQEPELVSVEEAERATKYQNVKYYTEPINRSVKTY